jgi:hypothetical protein
MRKFITNSNSKVQNLRQSDKENQATLKDRIKKAILAKDQHPVPGTVLRLNTTETESFSPVASRKGTARESRERSVHDKQEQGRYLLIKEIQDKTK